MKHARPRITAIAIAGLLASTTATIPLAAQERVEVGSAASVAGNVTVDNDLLRRPVDVEPGRRIAWGDLIRTRKNSQMQILLLDRSSFGIGQRSRVRIDRFIYNPNEGRALFASFIKGALRFFSGSYEGKNSAEVSTPAGRIGIRGTAIDMLVGEKAEDIAEDEEFVGRVRSDDDEATLVVLRGPGSNTLAGLNPGLAEVTGADATVVLDEPGLAAYIPREGTAPIGPFRISNSGLARVQDQISPRWARSLRDGGIPDEVLIGTAAVGILSIILGTSSDGDDDDKNSSGSSNSTSTAPSKRVCEDTNGKIVPCPPTR